MFDKLKRTIKHTGFYALGNLSTKLVGFVLLPIYTKHISVAEYGILGIFEIIDILANHILSFGLAQSLLRWYTLADSKKKKESYVFTVFVFLLTICCLNLVLTISLRHHYSIQLFDTADYGNYFLFLFIAVGFTVINRLALTLLRIEEKSILYSFSIFCQLLLNLLLNIYFIVYIQMGVKGILLAQAISSGIVFLILLPFLVRRMTPKIELFDLKEMMVFSLPLVVGTMSLTILNFGDRFVLTELATFVEVGLYTLGHKFSNILKLFLVDAFALGLPVIGWQIVKENNNPQRFFAKLTTYLVFVLLWFGLALAAYAQGIIHRFALDSAYWDASKVIPMLTLGVVFAGIQRIFFFQLQIPKKTNYIGLIIGLSALSNIILNILVIPYFGIIGAACATMTSQLGTAIVLYKVVQKFYPVVYEIKRIITLFILAILLYQTTLTFNEISLGGRIVAKGVLILSYPLILYYFKFFESIEQERIIYITKNLFFRMIAYFKKK